MAKEQIVVICGGPLEVFGRSCGRSERLIKSRVKKACEFFTCHTVVVVTGAAAIANKPQLLSEAQIIRNNLIETIGLQNIGPNKKITSILMEQNAISTLENAKRTVELIERKNLNIQNVVVVTSDFHQQEANRVFQDFFKGKTNNLLVVGATSQYQHDQISIQSSPVAENDRTESFKGAGLTRLRLLRTPSNDGQVVYPRGFAVVSKIVDQHLLSSLAKVQSLLKHKYEQHNVHNILYNSSMYIVLYDLIWEGCPERVNHPRYGSHIEWSELSSRLALDLANIMESSPWTSFTLTFDKIEQKTRTRGYCVASFKPASEKTKKALLAYYQALEKSIGVEKAKQISASNLNWENFRLYLYLGQPVNHTEIRYVMSPVDREDLTKELLFDGEDYSNESKLKSLELEPPECCIFKADGTIEKMEHRSLEQYVRKNSSNLN